MNRTILLATLMTVICVNHLSAADDSGSCGESLQYTYTESNHTLTITGTGDMSDYSGNAPWYNYRSEITSVVLPQGLTSIGDWGFYGTAIKEIAIPSTVTRIGASAFSRSQLSSVSIPVTVRSIGDHVFFACNGLKSATVHAARIGQAMFEDCRNLTRVEFTNSSLNTIEWHAFTGDSSLIEVIMPEGVTTIRADAFSGCKSLGSISLPNAKIIGAGSFVRTALTEIDLPKVENIYSEAFSGCTSLGVIRCGNALKEVGKAAFENCDLLSNNSIMYFAATTPPKTDGTAEEMFGEDNASYLDTRVVLRVPTQSVSAYKAHEVWGKVLVSGGYADGLRELQAGTDYSLSLGGTISLPAPATFSICTPDGKQLFSGSADTFTLPAHGLYLLRINGYTGKVVY